jgi:alkylhydroperoxidase family enzyme
LSSEEARQAADAVGVPQPLAELNIFRVLLRQPVVAKAASDLLLSLLFRGKLDGRLRELVIMRIGWATACDYEWTQHWSIAQERFGVSADDLLAVRDWRSADGLDERDRAVLAATDESLESGTISPDTWKRLELLLGGPVELLELVAAIGTWRLISQLARSVEIPLEPGVASWPPEGERPTPTG